MKTNLRVLAAALAFVVAVPALVLAQSFSGVVGGVVKDAQGGVLPGASVQLVGKTGARNAVTDSAGSASPRPRSSGAWP